MPHIPDHATHDPELVAAYAAGDATGPDLAAATELVAACTECADLHRDLRAIATALPELPARRPPARLPDHAPAGGLARSPRAGAACSPPSPRPASGSPRPWARDSPPPASRACCWRTRAGSADLVGRRRRRRWNAALPAQVPVEALPDDTSTGRLGRGLRSAGSGAGRFGRGLGGRRPLRRPRRPPRPTSRRPSPPRAALRRRRRPRTSAARPPRAARRPHRATPAASRSRARTTRSPPPRTRRRSPRRPTTPRSCSSPPA